MPTYDYNCKFCGHAFEATHKIADRSIPCDHPCPSCGEYRGINIVIGATKMIGDTPKVDNGFREVLSKIHERTPGSILKDNFR